MNWFLQRNTTSSGDGRDYCTQILCRDLYQYRSGCEPLQGNTLTQLSPQEEELRTHLRESELIQLSPQEKKLKALRDRVSAVFHSVLIGAVLIAGAAWYAQDPVCNQISLAFLSMAAGINLGNYAREYCLSNPPKEYYDKDNDQQIIEFVKGFTDDVCKFYNLNLSPFSDHLRYFNPIKLREETYKKFDKQWGSLTLRGCRLTDEDLGSLAKAGWFSNPFSINVSDNPQLTGVGLNYVGEAGGGNITYLNLSNTDLTDDDLKQMVESGYFENLRHLVICYNPRITGEGLALIKAGFKNLVFLYANGNPLMLGENLEKWSGKGGFENLEVLSLSYSGLTGDEFERILEENDWIKNLKGLEVSGNPELKCPSNVAKLTNLSTYELVDGLVHFEGRGLIIKNCPTFGPTNEGFRNLSRSHKAFF